MDYIQIVRPRVRFLVPALSILRAWRRRSGRRHGEGAPEEEEDHGGRPAGRLDHSQGQAALQVIHETQFHVPDFRVK